MLPLVAAAAIRRAAVGTLAAALLLLPWPPAAVNIDRRGWVQIQPPAADAAMVTAGSKGMPPQPLERVLREMAAVPVAGSTGRGSGGEPASWEVSRREALAEVVEACVREVLAGLWAPCESLLAHLHPHARQLIGQGASGKAYHVRGEGDDWVVKVRGGLYCVGGGLGRWMDGIVLLHPPYAKHTTQVGEGAAAGQGLRRECALLQRINSRGVERCLGVGDVDGGRRTLEVLAPYLVDDQQLDRYGDWVWFGVFRGVGVWVGWMHGLIHGLTD
jgi:hypothetical protein